MYFLLLSIVFLSSALTLVSGFGLGTLLMPVYAIFYPLDIAIALTAIVHLMNNLFKVALLGKYADVRTVLVFGFPGILFALLGAWLLTLLQGWAPLWIYDLAGHVFQITLIKVLIACLMIVFAVLELLPSFKAWTVDGKYLLLGGALSGFFGGLSGHQGALRSAFLIRCGLSKESFIATGVVIACLIDLTRLSLYGAHFLKEGLHLPVGVLAVSVGAAYLGVVLGKKLVRKITVLVIQKIVSVMLIVIAVLLGSGLI